MKIWKRKIKDNKFGICIVKEMTDKEVVRANSKGINYAPRSHGFVNLFNENDRFIAWCGVFYAEEHMI